MDNVNFQNNFISLYEKHHIVKRNGFDEKPWLTHNSKKTTDSEKDAESTHKIYNNT